MFAGGEHKFEGLKHKFAGGEHKFECLEHKIIRRTGKKVSRFGGIIKLG
jgi:hypothetical protein